MFLSDTKTVTYYTHSLKCLPLSRVMDLDIIFHTFSFHVHIDNVVMKKANQHLSIILRISNCFNDIDTIICLSKTLVRPVSDYRSNYWDSFYHSHNIEMVQNK